MEATRERRRWRNDELLRLIIVRVTSESVSLERSFRMLVRGILKLVEYSRAVVDKMDGYS